MACSYGLMPDLRVQDHSLEDIWNHQWYRNLRTDLANGRFVGRCGTCPYVNGCEAHQTDPVRPGVKHSQESRFFANGYTSRPRPSGPSSAHPFVQVPEDACGPRQA